MINPSTIFHRQFPLVNLAVFFALLILTNACANMGVPSGGEKDTQPPVLIKAEPENFATQVSQKRFKLYFDEYIVAKDLNKQLLISPPIKEKPDIRFKGKSIQIDFKDELLPKTTYSINFGNAIADNNEGNVLKDFQYVFSTGDHLDTLQIGGTVYHASTGLPAENALVLLYSNLTDSAPYNELPLYMGRTDSKGAFSIKNIRDTSYRLVALIDGNSSFTFDQPSESIGFIADTIHPYAELITQTDTIPGDSIRPDSVVIKQKTKFYPSDLSLNVFVEDYYKQYLKSKSRNTRNHMLLVFSERLSGEVRFSSDQPGLRPEKWTVEYSRGGDSLHIWICDSIQFNNDSLYFFVEWPRSRDFQPDSLSTDTINLKFNKAKEKKTALSISFKPKKHLELSALPSFTSNLPLQGIDTTKLSLLLRKDTLNEPVAFELIQDSVSIRTYRVKAAFAEGASYLFIADSAAFKACAGSISDSAAWQFQVRSAEYYGQIILNYNTPVNEQAIVWLLDEKENRVREYKIEGSSTLQIPYLRPGTYKLRVVLDANNNGKWDSGNYLGKIQPEKVINHPESIKVRANWDIEVKLDLNDFNHEH